MEPTFKNGEYLLLNKYAYKEHMPERGDVVVVKSVEFQDLLMLKRVIGIPGDTIEIKDNIIYLNGQALQEEYIKEKMINVDIEKIILSEDEYFICGDNRNYSLDSRAELLGAVNISEFEGKLIFNISRFEAID